jgi:hypothetical protein
MDNANKANVSNPVLLSKIHVFFVLVVKVVIGSNKQVRASAGWIFPHFLVQQCHSQDMK